MIRRDSGRSNIGTRASAELILRSLVSAALLRRRDLGEDGWREVSRLPLHPRVGGVDNIPRHGPFILVMNHYDVPGLRVWWPVFLVSAAVWRRRGSRPSIRWMMTDRLYRFRTLGVVLPDRLIAALLCLIAWLYGNILVSREAIQPRGPALRTVYKVLHPRRGEGTPIGVTPEAVSGSGPVLSRPWPSSGLALAWLSRGEVPLLPAAVYEDADGRLIARLGPAFVLEWPGLREARRNQEVLGAEVMRRIAELMPLEFRGPYTAGR